MAFQYKVGTHEVQIPDGRQTSYSYQIDSQIFFHSGEIKLNKADGLDVVRSPKHQPDERQNYIVQFKTLIFPEYHRWLKEQGAEVIRYVPDHSLLVSLTSAKVRGLKLSPFVNRVTHYGSHHKMASLPRSLWLGPVADQKQNFDILAISKVKKGELISKLRDLGLNVLKDRKDQFAIRVEGRPSDMEKVATWGQTLWVEESPGEIELDMDIVLIQGGAQALIQSTGNYQGEGIRGHVFEGIFPDHQDFKADEYRDAPIAIGNSNTASHGHSTFGIIYGSGAGDQSARGLIPRAQGYYTHYDEVYINDSRLPFTEQLIKDHKIMLQTASWGYTTTTEYTARSLEMDDLIFQLDLPITQSQSNRSSKSSRPQAWAKNIISVGAVFHGNNTDFSDDSWEKGGASIGPASDGRIKPDIISYYDGIYTTGSSGYTTFGGTSGATPIVNGHLGIILEMFTDGLFGNPLKYPLEERFLNRPHASTAKALLINSARQYEFKGLDHDMTRVHQGWGHPSLDNLYRLRDQIFIIDEDQNLQAMESKSWDLEVAQGQPQLTVTLVYTDPAGMVGAQIHRVNDLDLIVTSPDGTQYFGNYGLSDQTESRPGGSKDSLNTVENVIVKSPTTGIWKVEVRASEVNQDGHVETPEIDADFALVASGVVR